MRRLEVICLAAVLLWAHKGFAEGTTGDIAFAAGDYAAAYRDWKPLADGGDVSAMRARGMLYDTGHGVTQDFAAALAWYRRAAEAGSVQAMFNVGAMFDNGRGTPADRTQAIEWYRRAASQGHGRAAYNLGVIYRDGDGTAVDTAAAVGFFRLAATAGIAAAQQNLISLHAAPTSKAAPQAVNAALSARAPSRTPATLDSRESDAIGRFQQAVLARATLDDNSTKAGLSLIPILKAQVDRGNPLAAYDMGYAYEHGLGVGVDPVAAYVDYLKAVLSSEPNVKAAALRAASEVGRTLTDAQHAAARDIMLDSAR